MLYLRHPAWLWLKKHDRAQLPAVDANLQAMFDAGHAFEEYAESLFPNGTKLGWNNFHEYRSLPKRTQDAIDSDVDTIFQGRIEAEDATFIFDVLQRNQDGSFDLYEIKSSTKVKSEHHYDLAFQLHVATLAGIDIRKLYVIHINNRYQRRGALDINALTVTEEVTESVVNLATETSTKLARAHAVVNSADMPDASPAHASPEHMQEWLEIFKQLYTAPDDSIYNLYRLTPQQCAQLEELGVEAITDIPNSVELSAKQQRQVIAAQHRAPLIKTERISTFLSELEFPLYFLDYETIGEPIPPYDGLRPYQQLPFQYSLHVLTTTDSELQHYEYLHTHNSNPTEPLLDKLTRDIPAQGGSVVVWSKQFEQGCNDLMAALAPHYSEHLQQINSRLVDLMDPFAHGWYVDHRFGGSASIKNVLPVLAPDMSYKELAIQEGASAQRMWVEAVLYGQQPADVELFANLRDYCRMDTMAMVRIFEVLCDIQQANGADLEQASLF